MFNIVFKTDYTICFFFKKKANTDHPNKITRIIIYIRRGFLKSIRISEQIIIFIVLETDFLHCF